MSRHVANRYIEYISLYNFSIVSLHHYILIQLYFMNFYTIKRSKVLIYDK